MGLINAVINIFQVIYEEGEKEWLDESKYKEMLNELYEKLESGEIDDEEYEEFEQQILYKLKAIRTYKRENDIIDA